MVALLLYLSAAASGIFAGAMLTEAMVMVPSWREISGPEFLAWYAANDERLLGYFGPLTVVTMLTTLAAAGGALRAGHPGRWLAVAAAVLVLITVVMFPLFFQGVNESFSTASIPAGDVAAALDRWAGWHWTRTVLSLGALAAALLAVRAGGQGGA